MRKICVCLICFILSFTAVSGDDSVTVMTSPASSIDVSEAQNVQTLPRSVRSVSHDGVSSWAVSRGILKGENTHEVCTWEKFFLFLWRMNGSPEYADPSLFLESDPDWYREREHALAFAVAKGLAERNMVHQTALYQMTHRDAQWALWHLAGEPMPLEKPHKLPYGMHDVSELWACDTGLIVYEEQPFSDPSVSLMTIEALSYLYYTENRRYENSFPITVEEFLSSCRNVTETARLYGYVYGSSTASNPTTDGKISCDRLIAKALYDLGFTDQPAGGITCGDADAYLSGWGFERSTSMSAIRRGSILLVKHTWSSYTDHMFVAASDFDFANMRCDRYDCGSNGFIQSVQPIPGVGFSYKTDDIIVYNIPG